MYWNIYIFNPKNKVLGTARKERLFIKECPTIADQRAATLHAAKVYGVDDDLVFAIPTPQSELN